MASAAAVTEAAVCVEVDATKEESMNHVAKRVGSALFVVQ